MKLLVVQSLHHHLKSAEQGFFSFSSISYSRLELMLTLALSG